MFQTDGVLRIFRGIWRRFNNGKPLDSYPFLSGDSYFFSCQYYFESGSIRKVPSTLDRRQKEKSLFVKIGDLDTLILFLEKNFHKNYSDYVLILHNGDENASSDSWEILASRFRRILSVNLSGFHPSFTPIPIGLENRKYFTNGVPSDFKKIIRSGLKSIEEREIVLLQAFSLHTNPKERGECIRVAQQLGVTTLKTGKTSEYRRALSESKFVLSPAGNGFDCHRTWEAMYLGAIPIVKREFWPFVAINLPVLQVDEWEDLLNLDLSSVEIPHNSTWSEDFWDSFYND